MDTNQVIKKINDYLVETENYASEFLPLKETLEPIQNDFQSALQTLKQKSNEATDVADRVFYINRYTDLIKKIEGIFDTRSKRLQNTISILSKLNLPNTTDTEQPEEQVFEDTGTSLTPEQANEILKILQETNKV